MQILGELFFANQDVKWALSDSVSQWATAISRCFPYTQT